MKLLFWRRKPKPPAMAVDAVPSKPHAMAAFPRSAVRTGGLPNITGERVSHGPTLRFARDYFAAAGARVRIDAEGTLIAEASDGSKRRYTTAAECAREDERVALLVHGGAALESMLDDATSQTRRIALLLPSAGDPATLVRETLAEPTAGCSACVSDLPGAICEQCPLRNGRLVVKGFGPIRSITERGRSTSRAIELTYALSGTYRNGRLDDCLRMAFDLRTGAELPALSKEQILLAEAQPVTSERGELDRAAERAQTMAQPALQALGHFLRLRSLPDHSRLLDDLRQTHARLLRDDPAGARATEEAFSRELARLTELFAVSVTARLESVCLVDSVVAQVAVRGAAGAELCLDVDLGRRMVLPPRCPSCGKLSTTLAVRSARSVMCPSCWASAASSSAKTPACVSEAHDRPDGRTPSLTVAHLDVMGPLTWRAFLHWLLEREGCAVDPYAGIDAEAVDTRAARLHLRARRGEQLVSVLALRRLPAHMSTEVEVREAAALGMSSSQQERLLITPSRASSAAPTEAARLGVRLFDYAALSVWLAERARAYDTEQAQAQRDAQERADEASRVRETAVSLLQEAEAALASVDARRATGGAEVAAAAATVTVVHQTAERLFLAWETFLSDWSLSFDERPDRNGRLVISAHVESLRALAERARHLGRATVDSAARFAVAPAAGELGYTAWRRAALEELTARCEAVRWRLLALDPASWMAFAACHDATAQERAAAAATAASHAAARVASSYARLRARVQVE